MGDLTGHLTPLPAEVAGASTAVSAGAFASAAAPVLGTELGWRDRLGTLKVRLNIGRGRYRVEPGLYRVGDPTPSSPVLVTSNYKLTVDSLRSELEGVPAWLLVLDTKGVNVWCAAGKGTFSTKELCERVLGSNLYENVDHTTLVLPQLGASGVSAHDVKAFTGFRVVYGPVRAADIPEFLRAGMKSTPAMRRVPFALRDRLVLTGVELSVGWRLKTLASLAAIALVSGVGAWGFSWSAVASRGGAALLAAYGGLLAGAFFTPALLPWLPFRAFSAKGALLGGLAGIGLAAAMWSVIGALAAVAVGIALTVVASYAAMNFTGSSTFTSPSGVEREMRRALPPQIAGAAAAVVLWLVSMFIRG